MLLEERFAWKRFLAKDSDLKYVPVVVPVYEAMYAFAVLRALFD